MTASRTIDQAALMSRAWAYARAEHWRRRLPAGTIRGLLPDALRRAWADLRAEGAAEGARAEAMEAALAPLGGLSAAALRAELAGLDNARDWRAAEARRPILAEALRRAEAADARSLPLAA